MAARKRKSRKSTRKISFWQKLTACLMLAVFLPAPQVIGISEPIYSNIFEKGPQYVSVPARVEPRVKPKVAAYYAAPKAVVPKQEQQVEARDLNNVWDELAECESGGNWSINTGNGYYGGVQFSLGSWNAMGGEGLPSEASKDEQIAIASALQARSGWGQWPACSRKLGLM